MKYNLTFKNEIGRGAYESRCLHLPSPKSGITIGPGYDLKHRTPNEIQKDLLEAGVNPETSLIISGGAGLIGNEAKNFINKNKDVLITTEQEQELFKKIVPVYEARAKRDYDSFNVDGKPDYNSLPQLVKELLVDYAYNVGVKTFPSFFTSIIKGDKEKAMNNYKRYASGKPLGQRNKDTLALLETYDFKDLRI